MRLIYSDFTFFLEAEFVPSSILLSNDVIDLSGYCIS